MEEVKKDNGTASQNIPTEKAKATGEGITSAKAPKKPRAVAKPNWPTINKESHASILSIADSLEEEEKKRIAKEYKGKVVFISSEDNSFATQAINLLAQTEISKRDSIGITGGKYPLLFRTSTKHLVRLELTINKDTGEYTSIRTPKILDLNLFRWMLEATGIAWMRYNVRTKKWERLDVPQSVARTIYSSPNKDKLPFLRGCLSSPTIDLQTGTVSSTPGYDEATGWFSSWTKGWFPMDKDNAITVLDDALGEFPFKTKVDQAVAVAAVLTAVIRPMLRSAPGFAFAGASGVGKSCLCSLLDVMRTGRVLPSSDFNGKSDDFRKLLFVLLRGVGLPVVTIDHIQPKAPIIKSPLLNTLLSREKLEGRVLWPNKTEEIDISKTLWLLNGIALTLPDDVKRRVLFCQLRRGGEKPPYLHAFKRRHFLDWAEANHKKLVTAALSLVSAYITSGKPKPKGWVTLAEYETWADIVSGTCLWCGYEDPLTSIERPKAKDSSQKNLLRLFNAWEEAFGVGSPPVSSAEILRRCFPMRSDSSHMLNKAYVALGNVLLDILGFKSCPRPRGLTEKLKEYDGATLGNLKFTHGLNSHTKLNVFSLISPAKKTTFS